MSAHREKAHNSLKFFWLWFLEYLQVSREHTLSTSASEFSHLKGETAGKLSVEGCCRGGAWVLSTSHLLCTWKEQASTTKESPLEKRGTYQKLEVWRAYTDRAEIREVAGYQDVCESNSNGRAAVGRAVKPSPTDSTIPCSVLSSRKLFRSHFSPTLNVCVTDCLKKWFHYWGVRTIDLDDF